MLLGLSAENYLAFRERRLRLDCIQMELRNQQSGELEYQGSGQIEQDERGNLEFVLFAPSWNSLTQISGGGETPAGTHLGPQHFCRLSATTLGRPRVDLRLHLPAFIHWGRPRCNSARQPQKASVRLDRFILGRAGRRSIQPTRCRYTDKCSQ